MINDYSIKEEFKQIFEEHEWYANRHSITRAAALEIIKIIHIKRIHRSFADLAIAKAAEHSVDAANNLIKAYRESSIEREAVVERQCNTILKLMETIDKLQKI